MNYLLFTTSSCPKCPEVKTYVQDNLGIRGRVVDNSDADFMNLATQHGVMQAPTLLVFCENKGEEFRGNEVGEIEYWLKQHPEAAK